MNRTYTKKEFQELDFYSKCVLLENFLIDDYYSGQLEINFYFPPEINGEPWQKIPETPPEIQKIEDEKFNLLIEKLTTKLFESKNSIEFDLDVILKKIDHTNQKLFNTNGKFLS
jgi:hypothetical protein